MHGPYPGESRTRVIDFVEEGGSRREAAEPFDVSVSSAIRWMQRFREKGTFEPMPSGGSTSPLEKHSRQILGLNKVAGVEELIQAVGASHRYLPPYSPDLNPIELLSHPLKTCLRKAAERTMEGLHRCVRSYIRVLDPAECISYFRHSGYEPL